MEAMWTLIWNAAHMVQLAIVAFLFGWFARHFVPRGWKMATLLYYAAVLACYWAFYNGPGAIVYSVPPAVAFCCLLGVDKKRVYSQLFVCAVFYSLWYIASFLGTATYTSLYNVLIRPDASHTAQMWGFIGCNILDMATTCSLLGLAVWLMVRLYPDPQRPITAGECFLLLAPCAAAIASFLTISYVWSASGHAGDGVRISWARATQQVVSFASIVATVVLFSQVRARQEDERRAQLLTAQIGSMRSYIARVEEMAVSMRTVRHDLRGHMQTLQDLETAGAAEAALEYATAAEREIEDTFEDIRTGNPVTDVILAGFSREADRTGIRFDCQFRWPDGFSFDAFDIGVILHNALTNAFEAQSDIPDPFVDVRSFVRGHSMLIEVANRCLGAPSIDASAARLPTTKENPAEHGLGLPSIEATASKYGGTAEISRRDGVFTLRVLLTDPPGTPSDIRQNL